nr:6978_t:CDS:2 [Entrophospora candida]
MLLLINTVKSQSLITITQLLPTNTTSVIDYTTTSSVGAHSTSAVTPDTATSSSFPGAVTMVTVAVVFSTATLTGVIFCISYGIRRRRKVKKIEELLKNSHANDQDMIKNSS